MNRAELEDRFEVIEQIARDYDSRVHPNGILYAIVGMLRSILGDIVEPEPEFIEYFDRPHRCGERHYDRHIGWANHQRQWHDKLRIVPECGSKCAGLEDDT
jgi:hypothetical protein